jgi:hypothetical protein
VKTFRIDQGKGIVSYTIVEPGDTLLFKDGQLIEQEDIRFIMDHLDVYTYSGCTSCSRAHKNKEVLDDLRKALQIPNADVIKGTPCSDPS